MEKLEELATGINTGNVEPITTTHIKLDNKVRLFTGTAEDIANNVLGSDNPYIVNNQLQKEIDQLKKQNKQLSKDLKEVTKLMEQTTPLLEELNDIKALYHAIDKLSDDEIIKIFRDRSKK